VAREVGQKDTGPDSSRSARLRGTSPQRLFFLRACPVLEGDSALG
jgi:hypothetical protein